MLGVTLLNATIDDSYDWNNFIKERVHLKARVMMKLRGLDQFIYYLFFETHTSDTYTYLMKVLDNKKYFKPIQQPSFEETSIDAEALRTILNSPAYVSFLPAHDQRSTHDIRKCNKKARLNSESHRNNWWILWSQINKKMPQALTWSQNVGINSRMASSRERAVMTIKKNSHNYGNLNN